MFEIIGAILLGGSLAVLGIYLAYDAFREGKTIENQAVN